MSKPVLDAFHEACRSLDFRTPMESLLREFRQGNIADGYRQQGGQGDSDPTSVIWSGGVGSRCLPEFPDCPVEASDAHVGVPQGAQRRLPEATHHHPRADVTNRGIA